MSIKSSQTLVEEAQKNSIFNPRRSKEFNRKKEITLIDVGILENCGKKEQY